MQCPHGIFIALLAGTFLQQNRGIQHQAFWGWTIILYDNLCCHDRFLSRFFYSKIINIHKIVLNSKYSGDCSLHSLPPLWLPLPLLLPTVSDANRSARLQLLTSMASRMKFIFCFHLQHFCCCSVPPLLLLLQVGHVLARHHAERLSQLNVTGLINMLARALLGIQIPGALVVLGMFLPYSRWDPCLGSWVCAAVSDYAWFPAFISVSV